MSTTSNPRVRVPKGTSTGGQFAATERDEAAVDLAAPTAKTPRVSPRPRGVPVERDDGTVVVPKGAYYLGDPCYVFHNDERGSAEWDRVLASCDYFGSGDDTENTSQVAVVTVPKNPATPEDGKTEDLHVVAFHTAYGDGGYEDRDGREYSVDAGLIGLVPAWWAVANAKTSKAGPDEGLRYLTANAQFVVFDTDATCSKDGPDDGLLTFGPVEVVTYDEPETCGNCGEVLDGSGWCSNGCYDEEEPDCDGGCGYPESDCHCDDEDDED